MFTRNGRDLVVADTYGDDFTVYDARTGRIVRRVGGRGQTTQLLALSPTGSRLAVGYMAAGASFGAVAVYDTRTWARRFVVTRVPYVQISALAFSPDGSRLAIGAEDGTAGVWSLAAREQVASYAGPTAAVTTMAFTPNGQSVLTASNDGVVRLWRALGVERSFLPVAGTLGGVGLSGKLLTRGGRHRREKLVVQLPPARARRGSQDPLWGVRGSRSAVRSPPTAGSAFSSPPPAPPQVYL